MMLLAWLFKAVSLLIVSCLFMNLSQISRF
nr:MAG TPA: hypothetical protein [Bacteriophage sp.]